MSSPIFDKMAQSTPQACLIDLVPPVFAGITGLVQQVDGSLLASWAAGTDSLSPPVEYDVYIQADSATNLFQAQNLIASTFQLGFRIYTDSFLNQLTASKTYFVGVKARDRAGNVDSNVVSLSEESLGVSLGQLNPNDLLLIVNNLTVSNNEVKGSIDDDNDLIASIDSENDLVGKLEDC